MNLYTFLEQAQTPRIVVTYPGRFQPFHQGHAAVFQYLQQLFGADSVYILTSNKTDNKKSPFNFSDKVTLMTYAGIPADKIIETTMMYSLPEQFDPTNTVFITAVGSPDRDRLRPDTANSKFRTWGTERPQTADKQLYVVVIPEVEKSIQIKGKNYDVSHGTECRNLWNLVRNDRQARQEFLAQLYGSADPILEKIFNKIPMPTSEDLSPMGQSTISPIRGNRFNEEAAGVGVIASKKQSRDPRYKTSLTKDVKPNAIAKSLRAFRLAESINDIDQSDFITLLREFLSIAMTELGIDKLPKIKLERHIPVNNGQATFGKFVNDNLTIYLALADRHPIDILRTLAHELVHFKQYLNNQLNHNSGETGSHEENEAHAVAGIIMRHFNKKYNKAILMKPFSLDE